MIIPLINSKRKKLGDRANGILLHVSSLPSEYGIGDLGPKAYDFVNFLNEARQTFWQILPLNPTDPYSGNSPYSSPSAFAGNILFISPEILLKDGFVSREDLPQDSSAYSDKVHFEEVINSKEQLLDIAYANFLVKKTKLKEFEAFCAGNKKWLNDYALFMTIKAEFEGEAWINWPDDLRCRDKKALLRIETEKKEKIQKEKFLQFLFYSQWDNLKKYANSKGVNIVGDIPIYVSYDSVDVWKENEIFQLDEDKRPVFVAGVPPDYFSQTGQRWGNPVYNWEYLKETDFKWWIERINFNLRNFDVIRIDHFRGFVDYWAIPSCEETAVNGHWEIAPVDEFFASLKKQLGELPIIAEDLGFLSQLAKDKINGLGFPGMKILVFAFGGNPQDNPYMPFNFGENAVVYTGTHDNNTVVGWFHEEARSEEKMNLVRFMNREVYINNIHLEFIEIAMNSRANLSIIPIQDVLGLPGKDRMNIPGTPSDNWKWRMLPNVLDGNVRAKLAELTSKYRRY